MKKNHSLWITVWLLIFGATLSAQTNPATQKLGTATISGRITLEEKPAAGVIVGLLKAETMSQEDMVPVQRATTDSEGRYRLTQVVGGRFRLQAMTPGFVTEEQKTDMFSRGRNLNLNDGETVENMDFKLTKGGVITGKVTDGNGRPLIAGRLQLFQIQADGRKQQTQVGMNFVMTQTDDRGEYRLYGLLAGRYVIGVGLNTPGQQKVTYHPNTTSQDEATVVTVTPGSESRDVDIRLNAEKTKTFSVTARVVDAETGQPVPNVGVGYRLLRAGEPLSNSFFNQSATSDARGTVRLDNLSAGRYGAGVSSFSPNGQSVDYFSEATPFEIAESDVEGIEIRAQRGVTVSGVAVIEGITDPALTANLLAQLTADSASASSRSPGPNSFSFPRNFKINRDGTFRVSGLAPGILSINLNQRAAVGFIVVKVESENHNDQGEIVLAAAQPLAGVRLVLAYGTGVIRGQAQYINGTLPADARVNVQLRRADVPARGPGGRSAEVDARGRFVLEGVPAGEYEITLTSFSQMRTVTTASDGTTTVTMNSGQSRPMMVRQKVIVPATGEVPVTMTLDLAAPQNPPK